MIAKLEEIKRIGAYAVNIFFGEDIGCDDMDVKTGDRSIICSYTPVGCLGGGRVYWKGIYADFVNFDFKSTPIIVSNPPKEKDVKDNGFYTWGTERYIEKIKEQGGKNE